MMEANYSTRVKAPATTSSDRSDPQNGTHDASALNPSGRAEAENRHGRGRSKLKFMRCKKSVSFGSFNTRTLRQPHNIGEMTEAASKFNIDVICVQEHRFVHEADIDYTKVSEKCTLV